MRDVIKRQPVCLWPVAAELGEGALWSPGEDAVWFVDIAGRRLHRFELATSAQRSWPCPASPGFVALNASGRLIVGLAKGLYSFDPGDGTFTLLQSVEAGVSENRLNDGAVGPDGALWFGSKNEPEDAPSGNWFRWTGRGPADMIDSGYVVTNGPAFSPDGGTLYHSDSATRRVLARTLGRGGVVGPNRLFTEIEAGAGYPDGLAVDAEGCVWVALWAGGAVRRYSPDGALLGEVRLPAGHVTKPAFGGPDRRTLFLTTARVDLDTAALDAMPLSGGLFAVATGVEGVPVRHFAG